MQGTGSAMTVNVHVRRNAWSRVDRDLLRHEEWKNEVKRG